MVGENPAKIESAETINKEIMANCLVMSQSGRSKTLVWAARIKNHTNKLNVQKFFGTTRLR